MATDRKFEEQPQDLQRVHIEKAYAEYEHMKKASEDQSGALQGRSLVEEKGYRIATTVFPLNNTNAGTTQPGPTFSQELRKLINRYSKENESNTPDQILANFLLSALEAFNKGINDREDYYGVQMAPAGRNIVMRQPRRW